MSVRVWISDHKYPTTDFDAMDFESAAALAHACAWKTPLKISYEPKYKEAAEAVKAALIGDDICMAEDSFSCEPFPLDVNDFTEDPLLTRNAEAKFTWFREAEYFTMPSIEELVRCIEHPAEVSFDVDMLKGNFPCDFTEPKEIEIVLNGKRYRARIVSVDRFETGDDKHISVQTEILGEI